MAMMTGEQKTILKAFSRALQQESHILKEHPDLIWQQLFNRLQWEPAPIPEILKYQLETSRAPWIRTWSPFTESKALIQTLSGHHEEVSTCAISPNGEFVVSGSQDETLKIWNVAKGEELFTLTGHDHKITACAISPDSRLILSASWDQTLRVWDATTGEEINSFKGHNSKINACAISPSGRYLLTASDDRTLIMWEFPSGKNPVTLRGHTKPVTDCAFSPDGRFILSTSEDETLRIWADENDVLHEHSGPVKSCAISPDGRFIVTAGGDFTLRIWKPNNSWTSSPINPEPYLLMTDSCAISPDGSLIASWSSLLSSIITIWDVHRKAKVLELEGHRGKVSDCVFSPDGRLFISASTDHTLKVWDVQAIIRDAGFMKEESGRADLTDLPGWNKQHAHIFASVNSWGNRNIQSGSAKIKSGMSLTGTPSPDGRYLVTTDEKRSAIQRRINEPIRLWDVKNGEECISHGKTPFTFSPDSRLIVSTYQDGLCVWDLVSGEKLASTERHSLIRDCAVSPKGHRMISSGDGQVRVWDTETGIMCQTLSGNFGSNCAFSPDGRFIFSSGNWLTVWEADTGRVVASAPLPWILNIKNAHPVHPFLTNSSEENPVLVELMGVDYLPPLITLVITESGPTLTCPVCRKPFNFRSEYSGTVITCPQPDCLTPLAVSSNPPLIESIPDEVEIAQLKQAISTHLRDENDEKLLQVLDRIEKAEPFIPALKLIRAQALIRLGRFREAIDYLEIIQHYKWVKSEDEKNLAIYLQGIAYSGQSTRLDDGDVFDAESVMRQAETRFKWAWSNLDDEESGVKKGFTEISVRRFSEAEGHFRPLAERVSPYSQACYGLALALIGQGRLEQACSWIKRFLENPGDATDREIEQAQRIYKTISKSVT